jgi:TPR repeat protein
MRRVLFVVFLVVACATVAAADSYEDALSAFLRKDYAFEAQLFRPIAEQSNAKAQYNLGSMYDKGLDVSQDYQEALKWYRKAAEQGHARAQGNLGLIYAKGRGVSQDLVRAQMWFTVSAEAMSIDEGRASLMFPDNRASRMTAAQIEKG